LNKAAHKKWEHSGIAPLSISVSGTTSAPKRAKNGYPEMEKKPKSKRGS
jgi:hypothetical protein